MWMPIDDRHDQKFRSLGVLPLAVALVAGGTALELAWAWYDPSAFATPFWEADEEDKVAKLNNAWHMLWRTVAEVGVPVSNPAVQKLDADMGRWWEWKKEWTASTLQRWIPFAADRDWDRELNLWLETFQEDNDALARAAGQAYRKSLEKKLDPRFFEPEKSITEKGAELWEKTTTELTAAPKAALFWPTVAVVGLAATLLWVGTRTGTRQQA
jgi:hypothetical protein